MIFDGIPSKQQQQRMARTNEFQELFEIAANNNNNIILK